MNKDSRKRKNAKTIHSKRTLLLESLQRREMFAGDLTLTSDGVLHIQGTEQVDEVRLSGQSGNVIVDWTGRGQSQFSSVVQVQFAGGAGDDRLVRESASNIPVIAWGVESNNFQYRSDAREFAVDSAGTTYWLNHSGLLQEKLPGGSWTDLATDVIRFDINNDDIWTLHEDTYVRKNGSPVWGDTRDFRITVDGTIFWLGIDGTMQRKLSGGNWEDLAYDVRKFELTTDNEIITLHQNNETRSNGNILWPNTRDFAITESGTTYWLGIDGLMQRMPANGQWENLAYDVTKFSVTADERLLTLHETTNDLRIDGSTLWTGTRDFDLTRTGTIHWLGVNGLLQRKSPGGSWEDLASDVKKFQLTARGDLITLHTNNATRSNGTPIWSTSTRDFAITETGTIFWLGTDGLMQRKEPNGSWEDIGTNVAAFELTSGGGMLTLYKAESASSSADIIPTISLPILTLDRGTLRIQGTHEGDEIRLSKRNERVVVDWMGKGRLEFGSVSQIQFLGGDGNDQLTVAAGFDLPIYAWGGAGNDTLYGGDARDELHGSEGNDTLNGGENPDRLYGDDGDDSVHGGNGGDGDSLWGGSGNDELHGGGGNDELYGEAGDDRLSGDNGSDWIRGGGGNDTILGVDGSDNLDGGEGDDRLVYRAEANHHVEIYANAFVVKGNSSTGDATTIHVGSRPSIEGLGVDVSAGEVVVIRGNKPELMNDAQLGSFEGPIYFIHQLGMDEVKSELIGASERVYQLENGHWIEVATVDPEPGNVLTGAQKDAIRDGFKDLVENAAKFANEEPFHLLLPLIADDLATVSEVESNLRSISVIVNGYLDRDGATDQGLINQLIQRYRLSSESIEKLQEIDVPTSVLQSLRSFFDAEFKTSEEFLYKVSMKLKETTDEEFKRNIPQYIEEIAKYTAMTQLVQGNVSVVDGVWKFDFGLWSANKYEIELGSTDFSDFISIASTSSLKLDNKFQGNIRFSLNTTLPDPAFTLEEAKITGTFGVSGESLNGSLNVGPISLAVVEGHATLRADYELNLVSESVLTLQPTAELNLPVMLNIPIAGVAIPENSFVRLAWNDLSESLIPEVELSPQIAGLSNVPQIATGIALQNIVVGLEQLQQSLESFQSQALFTTELPIINRSLGQLVDPAEMLREMISSIKMTNPTTIDELHAIVTASLGLDSENSLFALDGSTLTLNLDYIVASRSNLPIDFSLLDKISGLVDLSGSAPMQLDAEAKASLKLIVDFSDSEHPVFAIGDTSHVEVSTKINSQDIDFTAAIGPLGVFIENGTASLTDGSDSGESAHWTIGLAPDPVDHRYELSEVVDNFESNVAGVLAVQLPVAFPTRDQSQGSIDVTLDLANSTFDLVNPEFDLEVSSPDFESQFSNIDLSDVFDQLLDGWDGTIRMLQEALRGKIGDFKIPLIGDQLADAAEFLEKMRTEVVEAWEQLLAKSNDSTVEAELRKMGAELAAKGLFEVLGPNGFDWLKDSTDDGKIDQDDIHVMQDSGDARFNFALGRDLVAISTPLTADMGLDGLGLDLNAELLVKSGFSMQVGFGVSTEHGFYFDTASDRELEFHVAAELPRATITGSLGFLSVTVDSNTAKLSGDFSVNVSDPSGDGRLTLVEIAQGPDIEVEASANADLNLALTAGFANENLPSIGSSFHFAWHADTDTGFGGVVDTLEFGDITLSMGSLIDGFTQKVRDALAPIKPLIDTLTTSLPIVNWTLVDLAYEQGYITSSVKDVVYSIKGILEGASLTTAPGTISVGRLVLDGNAARDSNMFGELMQSAGSFANDQLTPTDRKVGFSIPILDNPASVFSLLLGKDINLLTYDAPALDLEFGVSHSIPILGPIIANVGGGIGGHLHVGVGFDTRGLREFAESDFRDYSLLANGFYISDRENADGTGRDVPEATLFGEIYVGVGLDIGVLKVTVNGGILGEVSVDLKDPNKDGKVHFDEFIGQFGNGGPFDFHAGLYFELFAKAELDLWLFKREWRKELARQELVTFSTASTDTPSPVLAELTGDGTLVLNMGSRASKRVTVNTEDGDEDFKISYDPATSEVTVMALGSSQTFTGVKKIEGNSGKGNDTITLDVGTIPIDIRGGNGDDTIKVESSGPGAAHGDKGKDTITSVASDAELFGDDGDDVVIAGSNSSQKIHGGTGNDKLIGGEGDHQELFGDAGDDIIQGGKGNEQRLNGGLGNDTLTIGTSDSENVFNEHQGKSHYLDGGVGNDLLSGGKGSNVVMHGGDGDDVLTGSATNDTMFGDAGNDQLDGGAGDDELHGGRGNDILRGNEGADKLFGETGMDWLVGGEGADYLYGGSGADQLEGGKGDDHLWGGQGVDQVFGEDNNDTIFLDIFSDASSAIDIIEGGINRDTIVFNGTDSADIIRLIALSNEAGKREYKLSLSQPTATGDIERGSVSFVMPTDVEVFRVDAKGGDDRFEADAQFTDRLQIEGGDGDDVLVGGSGTNAIWGGKGNDLIIGGARADELHGGEGSDIVLGRGGADAIFGETGADVLIGGEGSDFVYGGTGISVQDNGRGDLIFGGHFHNAAHWKNGLPNNVTVSFLNEVSNRLMETESVATTLNTDETSGDEVFADDDRSSDFGDDDIVFGSNGRDTLYLGGGDDWADARGGSDIVDGGVGRDKIYGGQGYDNIAGGEGSDILFAGNDYVEPSDEDESVVLESFNYDRVHGDSGNDEIHGSSGKDSINGGSGSDTVYHSPGDDAVFGGTDGGSDYADDSQDTYIVRGTENAEHIVVSSISGHGVYVSTGDGTSQIGLNGVQVDHLGIEKVKVNALGGDDIVTIATEQDAYLEVEVDGGAGNDFINGAGGTVQSMLVAREMPDGYLEKEVPANGSTKLVKDILPSETKLTLIGGLGSDTIVGGIAQNRILGGTPSVEGLRYDLADKDLSGDLLIGNKNDDHISGGGGDDVIVAGAGDDILDGGDGNDRLSGGAGFDTLSGGFGVDVLDGGTERDALFGAYQGQTDGSGDTFYVDPLGKAPTSTLQHQSEIISGSLVQSVWAIDRVIYRAMPGNEITVNANSLVVNGTSSPVMLQDVGTLEILSESSDLTVVRGDSKVEIVVKGNFLDSMVPGTYKTADGSMAIFEEVDGHLKLVRANGVPEWIKVLGHNRILVDGHDVTVKPLQVNNRHAIEFPNGEVWLRQNDVGGKYRFGSDSKILDVVQTSFTSFRVTSPNSLPVINARLISDNEFVVDQSSGEWNSGVIVHRLGGTEIHWSNGEVFSDIDITGDWHIFTNGVPTIESTADGLIFTNQYGQKVKGVFVGSHEVMIAEWGNLSGAIEVNANATRIHWQNGTVWTRYQLAGNWFDNLGSGIVAEQTGNGQWQIIRGSETGSLQLGDYNSVSADFNGQTLEGSLEFTPTGLEIQWANGTVWRASDFSGMWFNGPQSGNLVSQEGNSITVKMSPEVTFNGTLVDSQTIQWQVNGALLNSPVVITSRNVTMTLPNGIQLGRMQLAGSWIFGSGPAASYAYIAQNGRHLTLINERGELSSGLLTGANTFTGWGMNNYCYQQIGTTGTGRPVIVWGNQSQWTQMNVSGLYMMNGKLQRIKQDGMYLCFINDANSVSYSGIDAMGRIRIWSGELLGAFDGNLQTLNWQHGDIWTYVAG